jgi:CRP-like cAMP-binding protein
MFDTPSTKSSTEFAGSPTMPDARQAPSTPEARHNHILAALPDAELSRWLPNLQLIHLPLGYVLYEADEKEDFVYFPTTVIVSLLYVMENGDSAELAVVGNEGIVGVSLFMGGNTTTSRAVVQNAGMGYRLGAHAMKLEFDRGGPVMHILLRYTQALIAQMSQTAGCNRHHELDKQLCRWLLLSLDRLPGNHLVMSQDLLAKMLGIFPASGVSDVVAKLQTAGLLTYADGNITVLDRPGLEAMSCECYRVVKKEYARLLPPRIAT